MGKNSKAREVGDRHENKFNYGLGSRSMERAGITAYCEAKLDTKSNGTNTLNSSKSAWGQFTRFIKSELNVKDLRYIERSHVESFGTKLAEQVENAQFKFDISSAKTYLSQINGMMNAIRGDYRCSVNAQDIAGLREAISQIATVQRAFTQEKFTAIKSTLNDKTSAQLEVQYQFAMRIEESSLMNYKQQLAQAEMKKTLTIEHAKGGQKRTIKLDKNQDKRSQQISALRACADIQNQQRTLNLVDAEKSKIQHYQHIYSQLRNVDLKTHDCRKTAAQEMYQQHSGARCPLASGVEHKFRFSDIAEQLNCTIQQAKHIDYSARIAVSKYLGHHRLDVTNAYLG